MSKLAIQLIGEFRVVQGDVELDLPPSKKTRALLAYLAVNNREFRREHLCELLWEIPDDPRGSLRWSLSKIRRLVDSPEQTRIRADRNHVYLDVSDVDIDGRNLLALVERADTAATEELIGAARQFNGEFLTGLELANFVEFSSWCIAERERIGRAQISLLQKVVARLQVEPAQALEFSRRLVLLNPYNRDARLELIELLLRCDYVMEAEQQAEAGTRLLREVGEDPVPLQQALRNRPATQVSDPAGLHKELISKERAGSAREIEVECNRKLVGREKAMDLLRTTLDRVVSSGRAECLLIEGEPGIGKSSLLDCARELARQAGAIVLRAGAFESEIVRPFVLWNDALRDTPSYEAVEMLSGNERIDRDQLFHSIAGLIGKLAGKQPVVIVFDDIQWCDESSAAALHYVLRSNVGLPILAVLGSRRDELQTNFAMLGTLRDLRRENLLENCPLEPLDSAEIEAIVKLEAPDVDASLVASKCQGNPLLAIELARALAAGDVLGTLNELIGERLARLDPRSIQMLQWAAVLAPNVSIGALIRYTGLDDDALEFALEEAEKSGFLFPTESGYRFSHDLVTASIYRAIAPARRRSMHRQIARILEADTALDLKLASDLARHASKSGDPLLAARALVQAARLCLRFYANEDAFKLAQRGLTFVRDLSKAERITLTLDLREVQLMSAPVQDWQAAVDEVVELAEQALDHGIVAAARQGYQMASNLRWAHGQYSGARKSIMQAERVTRGGSEEVQILGMAEAARCLLILEKDLPDADALLMEASARAQRNRIDSDALAAARGMLRYYQNRLDEAEEALDEARTRAKSMGDRMNEFQANEYLTMIEVERQDFDAARSHGEALLEIGEKLREGSEAPFARALLALCDYVLKGDDAGLAAPLEELRRFDAKQRLTYALNRAALQDLASNLLDGAIARAQEALSNAEIMERPSEIILARSILAHAYTGRGMEDAAGEQVRALLAMPGTAGAQWARERLDALNKALTVN